MILNSIRMYRSKYKATYGEIVVCSDGGNNWRKQVYPQYKFKRATNREESKVDWKEIFRITNMVLDEIKDNFPYKVVHLDECEADDIIGVLVENTQEFGNNERVLIVSADKDFGQLQKYPNVAQYSPMKKKFIKEDNPRKQLLELILKGDQADGIPNVLSSDDSFTAGIRQKPLRQKVIDQLFEDINSQGEEVYRNYIRNKKLIDLSETPDRLREKIIYTYNNQDRWENRSKVMPYFISKRCRQLLEDIGEFI